MAAALKRMEENSFLDVLESIQAEESAAESACKRLLGVSTLLEQQRGALEVVCGRMASWAIREVEVSAVSAELLVLDDAARLRGIKTMVELVKLIKADDVTLTLAPTPTLEELDEALKHAEAAQEHLLRCCAVVRCFQGVERVGMAGAEQVGVIAEGELGVAHKSLDDAVGELLKAAAATKLNTAAATTIPDPHIDSD